MSVSVRAGRSQSESHFKVYLAAWREPLEGQLSHIINQSVETYFKCFPKLRLFGILLLEKIL